MMKYLFETSINIFFRRVHYLLVCGAVEERNQVLLVFMFLFTENIQKAFAELTSMLVCTGSVCLARHCSSFGCLYSVLSGLICLHSCCACHRCIYGWESLCVYYVSMTVTLAVEKMHWNILWISIGNSFRLSFQQNKMTIVYVYGVGPLDIFRF